MTKRSVPKKADPGENFGIKAAYEGNPEGVVCLMMFVSDTTRSLSLFTPLPR